MKTLLIGSGGYIGPSVFDAVSNVSEVVGLDAGWFGHSSNCSIQKDIRDLLDEFDFSGFDCVVYLAAVSNDPMGKDFSALTHDINHRTAVKVATKARDLGVKKFIYASSCSAYGSGSDLARKETDPLNPLTDYARSKVNAEVDLVKLATSKFKVFCLRFATACGSSQNLRLDLVVNDFVASALTCNEIVVLSNGEPYRPLISVSDMALAIQGVVVFDKILDNHWSIYNVGSSRFTYKIADLAYAVADCLAVKPSVNINYAAAHDNRSYKVDFSNFERDFPGFVPQKFLNEVVGELEVQISSLIDIHGADYKNWIPHNRLKALRLYYKDK